MDSFAPNNTRTDFWVASEPGESGSDGNSSDDGRALEDSNETGLFISSTISKDDTSSKTDKQRGLLSTLRGQFDGDGLQLHSSSPSLALRNLSPLPMLNQRRGGPVSMVFPGSAGRGHGRGMPPNFPMPGQVSDRRMPGAPPGWASRGMARNPPHPSRHSGPIRSPPPPSWYRPGIRPGGRPMNPYSIYSRRKAHKQSAWRERVTKRRDPLTDQNDEAAPSDDSTTARSSIIPGEAETPSNHDVGPGELGAPTSSSFTVVAGEPIGGNGLPLKPSHGEVAQLPTGDLQAAPFAVVAIHTPEKQPALDLDQVFALPAAKITETSAATSATTDAGPGTKDSISSSRGGPPQEGLAEALSALAEKHLNVDVLDNSQDVSHFISYLLDTIQMLESQVSYHQARDSSDSESDADDDEQQSLGLQTVHRIYCNNNNHGHHEAIYEDEPVHQNHLYDGSAGLAAKLRILNLGTYLNRHPNICTIIFKEHECELKPRQPARRYERVLGVRAGRSERGERMRIVSPVLQKALSRIAEFPLYKEETDDLDGPMEMDAPYPFFFHHRKKLAELAQQKALQLAVEPLLKFLSDNYESEYEEADELFQQGKVTVHHLGKLFKPNQMVISGKSSHLEAYVLKDYATMTGEKIKLTGWGWLYNGTELQRREWEGTMDTMEEETLITDLEIHPADYARSEVIERLEIRGKEFWDMRGQVLSCYTGWDLGHDRYYNNARFMVDVATYRLIHRYVFRNALDTSEPNKYDRWPVKVSRHEELPAKAAMLLPATISGFNLHDKKWVKLFVEHFHAVDWNKKAFDRLVLDPKTKEMIYALVNVQTSANKMDDIITGKGNGLIILLHGSPGTGKTLTAESVAEIAEKPLYRVTCGDIGTEAQHVERYLETVLYLGKTWDCVLLLDEADVFLEERTMADLQRNSLVSVFLRVLEYYEGILILTSNRVGTFDEAFKSRIQVAIHYDNLTKKSRKAIWRNFFDMIEDSADEDANMPELERRLDELAAEEMNGRQIRNALLTARQLAKHRKERLDWEHLSQVMKTSGAFNKYLKTVRGHSDDQWAREEMLR